MQSTSDLLKIIGSLFVIGTTLLYGVGLYIPTLRTKLYRLYDQREQSPLHQRTSTPKLTLLLLGLFFLGLSLLLPTLGSVLPISTDRKGEIASTLVLLSGICLLGMLLLNVYTWIQERRNSLE